MDRYKYTYISHHDFAYCNPISSAKMEQLIETLQLSAEMRVLDFGAAKAELLIRLAERYHVHSIGIEHSPYFLREGWAQIAERLIPGQVELVEADATTYDVEPGSVDLAICIGASEIFGGYRGTLQTLSNYVKPGGKILVGEGYWKHEPDPAYLRNFGASRDTFTSHADNVFAGEQLHLLPLYAVVSSEDEWDHYEWLHSTAVERYAQQHSDDADVPELLERIRSWRELYLRWGRDTLGFGLYLFQKIK